jgi:hypothetical protein
MAEQSGGGSQGPDTGKYLSGGGDFISAYGTYQQGKMDYKMGKYNARLLKQNAMMARQKGYRDEAALRRQAAEMDSSNRVAVGKSGVAFAGSPLEVLADNAAKAELDAMNIRYSAETEARGLEGEAAMAKWRGAVARRQARISATSQLMQGGAKAASGGAGG